MIILDQNLGHRTFCVKVQFYFGVVDIYIYICLIKGYESVIFCLRRVHGLKSASLDMQLFPHIQAPHEPTDPLVVARVHQRAAQRRRWPRSAMRIYMGGVVLSRVVLEYPGLYLLEFTRSNFFLESLTR
jgi:hypothetical protein